MPIRRSPNGARHVRSQPGRNRPERVVAINRNAWSQSVGTGGRNHPVRAAEVKPAIFDHPEFTAFTAKAGKLFTQWQTASVPLLKAFAQNGHPKPLIETIAEHLLATFKTDRKSVV